MVWWFVVLVPVALWATAWRRARAWRAEAAAAWRQVDALLVGRHELVGAVAATLGAESALRDACAAAEEARRDPARVEAAEEALDAALAAVDPGRYADALADLDARLAATRQVHAHVLARYRRARRWVPGA